MSKRKGVSADEKRKRILQLFHEKNDFFQLKELEKIAPKEKGIIAQSVKDVVQSLVDDGLVDADKIGTSTYYWAYPNKAHKMKEKRLEEIETECHKLGLQLTQTVEALAMARASREESSMREQTLHKIRELRQVKIELETKMMTHADCNPRSVMALQEHIRKLKEDANRWTDNIYVVKSWCKNKFLIEGEAIDKHFGIPAELEYID